MASPNEVFTKVAKVLVDAPGVEEDEIKPSATLQADLGRNPSTSSTSPSESIASSRSRFRAGERFSERVFELGTRRLCKTAG